MIRNGILESEIKRLSKIHKIKVSVIIIVLTAAMASCLLILNSSSIKNVEITDSKGEFITDINGKNITVSRIDILKNKINPENEDYAEPVLRAAEEYALEGKHISAVSMLGKAAENEPFADSKKLENKLNEYKQFVAAAIIKMADEAYLKGDYQKAMCDAHAAVEFWPSEEYKAKHEKYLNLFYESIY